MEETFDEFWMVWGDGHRGSTPVKKHYSYNDAYTEARRLASVQGNIASFYVLHSVIKLFVPAPVVSIAVAAPAESPIEEPADFQRG